MRIAICDDQKEDREKEIQALKSVIRNFEIEEFEDGNKLVQHHMHVPYDMIILDVLMPAISGIDTAAKIRDFDTDTPIVFMSQSEEFGVQSYRVLAFDCLLKPIDKNQLKSCMHRLFEKGRSKHFITVTYSGTETKILLSNILCLESNLRKVVFTLTEKREIEVAGKLADFEQYLAEYGFCRCHKSYMVNIEHIENIVSDTFYLTDGKAVKISRSYLKSAKKAYFDYVFSSKMQ